MRAPVEWLVLCHETDASALWAARGLRRRLDGRLEVVTPEILAFATMLEHRIEAGGQVVNIELADGRSIESEGLRGVVSRMITPSIEHWRALGAQDAEYVMAELTAFHLGWLGALRVPVLNPPSLHSLAGRFLRPGEARAMAAAVGVPCELYERSTNDESGAAEVFCTWTSRGASVTVAVVGGSVFGPPVPPALADGCERLSECLGLPLLGLAFGMDDGGSLLLDRITPMPDLRIGGEPLLNRLAEVLQGGAR